MRVHLAIAACWLSLAISASDAAADPDECQVAINAYNAALSDLTDALNNYSQCVSNSRGNDDCSSEFSRLRSAQDDFEAAVSQYEIDCP